MYCPKCGYELGEKAEICPQCNTNVGVILRAAGLSELWSKERVMMSVADCRRTETAFFTLGIVALILATFIALLAQKGSEIYPFVVILLGLGIISFVLSGYFRLKLEKLKKKL
ncbi:MAG: zinc ribbon domain-containing protein [Candidatus Thermoplasmatota archaeon]